MEDKARLPRTRAERQLMPALPRHSRAMSFHRAARSLVFRWWLACEIAVPAVRPLARHVTGKRLSPSSKTASCRASSRRNQAPRPRPAMSRISPSPAGPVVAESARSVPGASRSRTRHSTHTPHPSTLTPTPPTQHRCSRPRRRTTRPSPVPPSVADREGCRADRGSQAHPPNAHSKALRPASHRAAEVHARPPANRRPDPRGTRG